MARRIPLLLPLLALLPLAAAPARGTSFVAVSDASLTAQAELVAVVRVQGRLPAAESGRPVTEYLVSIDRLLKGEAGSSALVVQVPGGVRADGVGQRIWGAPGFADGETALLFLRPGPDGTWRVLHLMQGAFHRLEVDGRPVAYRDLREAREVAGDDRRASRDFRRVRDFDRFADWVADTATGLERRPRYFTRIDPARVQAIHDRYSLFEEAGLNMRWFNFDSGGSVTYHAHQDGQQGITGGGFAEVQAALRVWNNESSTPINLVYGGTTSATGGLETYDATNTILFNDPASEIEDTFSCTGGGTLAFGGPWFSTSATSQFGGRTYIRIQGGDIVTNDGISCFFERSANPSKAAEELFAHELGHNLGLGHSSEDRAEQDATLKQALMYAYIHNDGRGGQLNSDDIAGLRSLYTVGGGSAPSCNSGGSLLCLLNRRFQLSVTWQNQFNGRAGVGGPIPNTDLSGFFYFDDPSNIELIVKVLDFGTEIKVFYSQLTNLKFELKVTDTLTGKTKTYTNTTGECGAIDNDFARAAVAVAAPLVEGRTLAERAGSCVDGPSTLCLLDGRFRLTVDWRNQFNGASGVGGARRLSTLTGAFAFTEPANLEILAKALDFGDKFLVLYGSLSNLEYTLRVTDTVTGISKSYVNPAGNYCGGIDTTTFTK